MRTLNDSPAGRKVLFAGLYLSEGAPIGYIWWALPYKLTLAGHPVNEVTALTSLLVLPWAFKFIWAPAIDVVRGRRWSLRAWIATAQIGMALTLLPLFALDLAGDLTWIWWLLLAHAVLASIQDVAVDTLAISITPAHERGAVNGWMQVGLLAGRSVFGGGLLVLELWVGEQAALGCLLGVICISLLLVRLAGSAPQARRSERWRDRLGATGRALGFALARRGTWCGVLFAATGGMAFEAVGAVVGPFLDSHGYGQDEVGWFYLLAALLTALGAVTGGYLSDRLGRRRAAVLAVVLVAAVVLGLAGADARIASSDAALLRPWVSGDPGGALRGLLASLYLALGLFTSTTYALFMDLTVPALAATQFAVFMSMTNLCESWSGRVVGTLIREHGYPVAFATMALSSLATVPLLAALRPGRDTPATA